MQSSNQESISKVKERFIEYAIEHRKREEILDKQVARCEHPNNSQYVQIDKCQNLNFFWKSLTSFLGGLPDSKATNMELFKNIYDKYFKKKDHKEKI